MQNLRRELQKTVPCSLPKKELHSVTVFSIWNVSTKNFHRKNENRNARKQNHAIWNEFWTWLETLEPAGGSKLEKAVNYAFNHKETLMNYLLDGRCEISNNAAERRAKTYVTGRKNFLFHDTADGATASAIVLSLIETAKANNLNIYHYLYTLLLYMPDYKNEPQA